MSVRQVITQRISASEKENAQLYGSCRFLLEDNERLRAEIIALRERIAVLESANRGAK